MNNSTLKITLLILILQCFITTDSFTQWDVFPQHVAFRYNDNTFDEFTHYTPNNISFWNDLTYNSGTSLSGLELRFFAQGNFSAGLLTKESLAFTDSFGDRVRLDYGGLTLVNGASWGYLNAYQRGNAGQLDLFNGVNGGYLARLGSTGTNSDVGNLIVYGNIGTKYVDITAGNLNQGIIETYGNNGQRNVRIGGQFDPDLGYIYVADRNGLIAAGMYAESDGDGVLFADVKNFRIAHPNHAEQDIWYASLEGPEVAIYERGTGQLENGEAFIQYSDHFSAISNFKTSTVLLSPSEWDTYGLAVVEKTDTGFHVKELKGGKGNFLFDWECKSVRKGKENYQVIRSKDYIQKMAGDDTIISIDEFNPLTQKQKPKKVKENHIHHTGCIHHKK